MHSAREAHNIIHVHSVFVGCVNGERRLAGVPVMIHGFRFFFQFFLSIPANPELKLRTQDPRGAERLLNVIERRAHNGKQELLSLL
jgi:hypothetical protein